MAQLAPIAALVGTGATLYSTVRQTQQQQAQTKQQISQARQQSEERAAQLAAQQEQDSRERADTLARTTAATRARLSASGVSPDEGSAAAITAGLAQDAAEAQADSDQLFRARLASGRRSLLRSDGSLTSFIRAGTSFASSLSNLLE